MKKNILNILDLNKRTIGCKAQFTSGPDYQFLRSNLNEISTAIKHHIGDEALVFQIGAGNGYMPRVPWIFISKKKGPVSLKVGVAVCFCKFGRGIVSGIMYPMGYEKDQKYRSGNRRKDPDFIDVDGQSTITKFNDRFVDPHEMSRSYIDVDNFLSEVLTRVRLLPAGL